MCILGKKKDIKRVHCIHIYTHTYFYACVCCPLLSSALWAAKPKHVLLQNLSAKLYSALRMLRTILVKEAGEGVMAYHIFGFVLIHFLFCSLSSTTFSIYVCFCLWASSAKRNSIETSFRVQWVSIWTYKLQLLSIPPLRFRSFLTSCCFFSPLT